MSSFADFYSTIDLGCLNQWKWRVCDDVKRYIMACKKLMAARIALKETFSEMIEIYEKKSS